MEKFEVTRKKSGPPWIQNWRVHANGEKVPFGQPSIRYLEFSIYNSVSRETKFRNVIYSASGGTDSVLDVTSNFCSTIN